MRNELPEGPAAPLSISGAWLPPADTGEHVLVVQLPFTDVSSAKVCTAASMPQDAVLWLQTMLHVVARCCAVLQTQLQFVARCCTVLQTQLHVVARGCTVFLATLLLGHYGRDARVGPLERGGVI